LTLLLNSVNIIFNNLVNDVNKTKTELLRSWDMLHNFWNSAMDFQFYARETLYLRW